MDYLCQIHFKQQADFYCVPDAKFICKTCFDEHDKHKLISISKYQETIEAVRKLNELRKGFSTLSTAKSNINSIFNTALNNITKMCLTIRANNEGYLILRVKPPESKENSNALSFENINLKIKAMTYTINSDVTSMIDYLQSHDSELIKVTRSSLGPQLPSMNEQADFMLLVRKRISELNIIQKVLSIISS